MKKSPSPFCRRTASTLLVTVLSISVLALLSARVMTRVTSLHQTALRSAAWNDAFTTAAAGVDMTIADLTSILPDVRLNSDEGLALGVSQFPLDLLSSLNISTTGVNLNSGITLSYSPPALKRTGEDSASQQVRVFIDVLPLSSILNSNTLSLGTVTTLLSDPLALLNGGSDLRLVRLRSRGTVAMGGTRRADADSLDAKLRRPSLFWDRLNNKRAVSPSVSREIEVLLRPVLPFQSAVTTAGGLKIYSAGSVIDSSNSTLPLTSTNGQYVAAKRLKNGTVGGGSADVTLAGYVYGNVRTNGGAVAQSDRVTGDVNNAYAQPLPFVSAPGWSSSLAQTSTPLGTTVLSAGSKLLPARYRFNQVNGTVRITRGLLGLATDVEIYVNGDVTGSLQFDPGVSAKVYLGGNMRLAAGKLVNGSKIASNLQIYGMGTDTSVVRGIELDLGTVQAAIYAPLHHVVFTGSGDFMGSVTGASFTAVDEVKLHFDEALGLNVGPVLRFAVTSWLERQI